MSLYAELGYEIVEINGWWQRRHYPYGTLYLFNDWRQKVNTTKYLIKNIKLGPYCTINPFKLKDGRLVDVEEFRQVWIEE